MDQVFPGGGLPHSDKPPHLVLRGTNFQTRVWSALFNVAPGQLVSYSQLARQAGSILMSVPVMCSNTPGSAIDVDYTTNIHVALVETPRRTVNDSAIG